MTNEPAVCREIASQQSRVRNRTEEPHAVAAAGGEVTAATIRRTDERRPRLRAGSRPGLCLVAKIKIPKKNSGICMET